MVRGLTAAAGNTTPRVLFEAALLHLTAASLLLLAVRYRVCQLSICIAPNICLSVFSLRH